MSVTEQKKTLRKAVLAKRNALPASYRAHAAEVIFGKLQSLVCYKEISDLCLYVPIRNEVDLFSFVPAMRADGKTIYLPCVEDDRMEFYRYDTGTRLVEGAYHIPEPEKKHKLCPEQASTGCLIVMPGAVFSRTRDRIGYGGGYYDRYLAEHPSCRTAATGYAEQVVDTFGFEPEETDWKPDVLLYN